MTFTKDEAAKVAALARLSLDDDKLELFASQFQDILGYMDTLNELDTAGVDPLYSPARKETAYREDKARQIRSREEILANAPEQDGQFFIVPKIV